MLVTFFLDIIIFVIVVVHEFCRISVEFLRKGINAKVYQTASRKCALSFSEFSYRITGRQHRWLCRALC